MTDYQAAVLFAVALEGTLDEYGHLGWCLGVYDETDTCLPACHQAREAVRLAIAHGYLPVPAADLEATRRALARALPEVADHPKKADKAGEIGYTNGNEREGPSGALTPPGPMRHMEVPSDAR